MTTASKASAPQAAQLLFVDDDSRILAGFKRILRKNPGHWNSHFATSADQAIDILRREKIDIIISDINMPDRSGFDLLTEIKHNRDLQDLPVLIITGNVQEGLKRQALDMEATDLLIKPVHPEDLLSRIRNMLKLKSHQDRVKQHNRLLDARIRERTRELEVSYLELIWRLAKTAECRDTDTGNHILRVAHYCHALARNLGLPPDYCECIFQASPLHDIGKIGIPDRILLKPGPLNDDERLLMQSHCTIGAEILKKNMALQMLSDPVKSKLFDPDSGYKPNPFLEMAADIALSHHERWDGSGYPAAAAGEDIPLAARICAVADVFDALTTARPYKSALPVDQAVTIMQQDCGRHFDPTVFACFMEHLSEFVAIRDELSDQLEQSRPS